MNYLGPKITGQLVVEMPNKEDCQHLLPPLELGVLFSTAEHLDALEPGMTGIGENQSFCVAPGH